MPATNLKILYKMCMCLYVDDYNHLIEKFRKSLVKLCAAHKNSASIFWTKPCVNLSSFSNFYCSARLCAQYCALVC